MTVKVYEQNPYEREWKSKVVRVQAVEGGYEVILAESIFYPEGGGQPGDIGFLNDVCVMDTKEKEGEIVHCTLVALEVGEEVEEKIDWVRRLEFSKQHSGEHIFSGIVHKLYGYDNVGFHMGSDYVTVDFNGMLSEEQIQRVEFLTNTVIYDNREIDISYPTTEELKALSYRSKKELMGTVRIVTIQDADVCACCGTHVKRTGEIGIVKVVFCDALRGGSRLTLKIGLAALEDYQKKHKSIKELSKQLSVQPEKTVEAVVKLKDNITELKFELGRLKEQILDEKASKIEEIEDVVLLIERGLSVEEIRKLCDKVMQKVKVVAVFLGTEEEEYFYVVGSKTEDVCAIGENLKHKFSGQGGGKNPMVQGKIKATEQQIKDFFN